MAVAYPACVCGNDLLMNESVIFILFPMEGSFLITLYLCRELEEYKEKQDDNQNGGDAAKISSKHVCVSHFLELIVMIFY